MATITLGVNENAATRIGRSTGTSCCFAAARVVRITSNSIPIMPMANHITQKAIWLLTGKWRMPAKSSERIIAKLTAQPASTINPPITAGVPGSSVKSVARSIIR